MRSAALLVIAIAGCGDGRTLLTVEIQSPLEVPEQLDRLCVSSRVDGGSMTALGYGRGTNLGGDRLLPGLPATVVFEDKDDEFDQITVSTEGTWRGRPVGRGLARASLVDHDQRSVEITVDGCAPRASSPIALERVAALPPTAAIDRRALLVDLDGDGAGELVEAPARVVKLSESTPEEVTGRFLDAPLGATFVGAGDVDHDCVADLVLAQPESVFAPLVWRPEGAAAPRRGPDDRVEWPSGAGGPFAIGDVDQSGAADVVVATAAGVRLLVADDDVAAGAGAFIDARGHVQLEGELDGEPSAVDMADLDGDGRLDVVVGFAGAADPARAVRILRGMPQSLAEVPGAFSDPEGRDVAAIAAAELDGDAATDLLVAYRGGGALLWSGTPGAELPRFRRAGGALVPDADARDLALLDLDGDCDLDVVLALGDAPSVVLAQTPSGLVDAEVELPPAIAVAAAVTTIGPEGERRPVVVLLDEDGGGSLWR